MSAVAILERIAPEERNDAAPTVNKFSVSSRLDRLAPEHQKAAISRAMRLAGMRARERPTLQVLAIAEDPPAADWRHPIELQTRHPFMRRGFDAADAGAARVAAIHDAVDVATKFRDPARAAEAEAAAAEEFDAQRVLVNAAEYEQGQALAEKWGPVLEILREMLDALEARVDDYWLAAVEEDGIREASKMAAWLGAKTTPLNQIATPKGRRAACERHHRRELRKRANRARQHIAALLGTIGAGGAAYADAYSLARWKERQMAAKAWGQAMALEFEDGERVLLWDVMEASRKARIAALYAQSLGLEELAQARGLLPIFITMTLPPQFHPNPKHGAPYGGRDWEDAPSPQDTDEALATMWARFRARCAASKIDLLGPRVVEPHQDGTPHLHALLYVQPGQEAVIDRHLTAICREPVPGRRIASKLAVIDRGRASPASYVMKYLLKTCAAWEDAAANADGAERDGDADHLAHLPAVSAWASERRLRRFAWLGLHGLRTVWQRVRTMTDAEAAGAPDEVSLARDAMARGHYAEALEMLGAVRMDERPRPRLEYETVENQYGERVKRPIGLTFGEWFLPLRRRKASIVSARPAPSIPSQDMEDQTEVESGFTISDSFPRGGNSTDIDGGGVGRTGPPPQILHNSTPKIC